MRRWIIIVVGLLLFVAPSALAEEPEGAATSVRPTVTVSEFEFGTIQKFWEGDWNIGKGVSDMLVGELLASGQLRLLERAQLDAVKREQEIDGNAADKIIRARYIVTGSVTKFGGETKSFGFGGLAASLTGKSYLSAADSLMKKTVAHVDLSVRVIDTTTGEIVTAVESSGKSKRRGMLLGGLGAAKGKVIGGAIQMGSSDFRETILGEATEAAVHEAAEKLVQAITSGS